MERSGGASDSLTAAERQNASGTECKGSIWVRFPKGMGKAAERKKKDEDAKKEAEQKEAEEKEAEEKKAAEANKLWSGPTRKKEAIIFPYYVGDRVNRQDAAGGLHPGTILEVNEPTGPSAQTFATYNIIYDDGTSEEGVSPERLRLIPREPKKVEKKLVVDPEILRELQEAMEQYGSDEKINNIGNSSFSQGEIMMIERENDIFKKIIDKAQESGIEPDIFAKAVEQLKRRRNMITEGVKKKEEDEKEKAEAEAAAAAAAAAAKAKAEAEAEAQLEAEEEKAREAAKQAFLDRFKGGTRRKLKKRSKQKSRRAKYMRKKSKKRSKQKLKKTIYIRKKKSKKAKNQKRKTYKKK